jgi:hypothetical protein
MKIIKFSFLGALLISAMAFNFGLKSSSSNSSTFTLEEAEAGYVQNTDYTQFDEGLTWNISDDAGDNPFDYPCPTSLSGLTKIGSSTGGYTYIYPEVYLVNASTQKYAHCKVYQYSTSGGPSCNAGTPTTCCYMISSAL